jgi:hypothetical protein
MGTVMVGKEIMITTSSRDKSVAEEEEEIIKEYPFQEPIKKPSLLKAFFYCRHS